MKPPDKPDFWFHAKRYGWGWGLPARWEGWVVLLGYGALIIGGIFLLMEQSRQLYCFGYIGILTLLLLAICWWKGEAPRWQWGGGTPEAAPPNLNTRGLLILHLFFGPLLLGIASYFHSSPPLEINKTYGYRTEAAMRSQEAWDEAQSFSSRALIVGALITIGYQVASSFLMKPIASLLSSCVVFVAAVCICIPLTESHLSKHFDTQGQRIVAIPVDQNS